MNKNMTSTYIDKNGYERFSGSEKLVSRWMAEKKIGRKLNPTEVIHHKNRNKLDNSFSNLFVCHSQDVHERLHRQDGYYSRIGDMV